MIVILEGIDRVGKTTIAKELESKLGFKIFKKDRIYGNSIPDKNAALVNYGNALGIVDVLNWDGFNDNIVIDRFHWTEAVYSLCDRDNREAKKLMGYVELKMLEKKEKYLIVYVRPTDIKFSSRMHGSDLSQHLEEFEKLYSHTQLPKYIATFYSADLVVKEVERRMKDGQTE